MAILGGEQKALDRQIFRLGVPSMVASLSVPLIGIVDTIFVGHLPDVAFLGAVSVGSVIFDVLYWGLGFLRMGTTALTAQYFGAGQPRNCTGVLFQAGIIALLAGLFLALFRAPLADLGFWLAGGSDDVQMWGKQYLAVRMLGAPLVLLSFVLMGFFRGLADAMTPMWLTIVVNVVNVVADYALIYGKWGAPELGVVGAAWASVFATGTGLVFGFGILLFKYRTYLVERPQNLLDLQKLRLLGATNFNLFGRTACLLFAQFFMLSQVARMGEVALAANAVLIQVWSLVSYCIDGIAHAAETLVGNALGAKDFVLGRQVAGRCLLWGVLASLFYTVVYMFGLDVIANAFTDHQAVAQLAGAQWLWVSLILPVNAAVFVWDGVFIGANDTRYLFGAMAVASFVVFLPAFIIFVYGFSWGLTGAWLGLNSLMVGRFIMLWRRYVGDVWLRSAVDV
ncbi:MAG: MATE family efflux transporter [Candidatus Latescibacteria bacterium]|jgi:multidrug resistance protein, MATE family|nr:MATE family efflux transporter [Candidatus Latescibacterota bacterium]MBT4136694.1 MATE family efflux transporter [Candidatus Latescibacterota bacterium]MBT5829425.1 MATE family efflux transporter [Candidatus Latescibacterota bacterium]